MTEMMFEVVVLDTGNGNGVPYSRLVKGDVIPAVMGMYDEAKQQGKGVRGQANTERTVYQVEADEQVWVMGKDVYNLRLDPVQIYSRDGRKRYTQPMFQKYAKILLTKALNNGSSTKNVFLVSTTTARDFQNASVHKSLKNFFEDIHKVKVNGETRLIPVERYEAMSETEAVVYDLLLDEEGNYRDENVLEQDILVINVGNGTTDIAHFYGCEFVNDISEPTIEIAYKEVIDRCAKYVSGVLDREVKDKEIRAQLDLQYEKEVKTFNYYGDEIEGFNDEYHKALKDVFEILIAEINRIIKDTGRFHRIVVVGGGAEELVWKKAFEKWDEKKVEVPDNPTISPSRGAYKWGVLEVMALTEEAAAAKE